MTSIIRRRVLAGSFAFAAAVSLAACSSDESSTDSADNTAAEATTEAEEANIIPTNFPNFTGSNKRWQAMEAEGCSADFEEWAHDAVVYFTDANGGNADYVKTSFESKDILGGAAKACEVTVSDAQIYGTPGGDLDNFTMLIHGLSDESNPHSKSARYQLLQQNEVERGVRGIDPSLASEISPLHANLVNYSNAEQATDGAITYVLGRGSVIIADLHGVNTHIGTYTLVPQQAHDEDGEVTTNTHGGWVAVTTDDRQVDTDRAGSNAAGQMARAFARQVNNSDGKSVIKISR